jgi:hypothetical protein
MMLIKGPEANVSFKLSDLIALLLLVVGLQIAVLIALGELTRGREFSDDISFLLAQICDPLGLLLANHNLEQRQMPPIMPILQYLFVSPFLLLTKDFFGFRLGQVFLETVVVALTLLLGKSQGLPRQQLLLVGVCLALLPSGWMTSVVMAQEEFTSALLLVLMLVAFQSRSRFFINVFGTLLVFAGKIFPLFCCRSMRCPKYIKSPSSRLRF